MNADQPTGLLRPDAIYVDSRALQHPNYRFRGIGYHGASILKALRRHIWQGTRPSIVALVDAKREPLHDEHRALFDSVQPIATTLDSRRSWFVCLSPMTENPASAVQHLQNPALFKVALVYDFIPLDHPNTYLTTSETYAEYLQCFFWLGNYDAFSAISAYSRDQLIHTRAIEPARVSVSGVAVRRQLEPPDFEASMPFEERRHIVVAGGGDRRKNPECALVAHAGSSNLRRFQLRVLGNYSSDLRELFRDIYSRAGGDNTRLVFQDHLDDVSLRDLYRNAVATVVPSRAEGFSIPIIESAANGTPSVVSAVGPHSELVPDGKLRFDPDDAGALRAKLEALTMDRNSWETAQRHFAELWPNYTADAVGRRFLVGIASRQEAHLAKPAISRLAKPRIAVLTPLPPTTSGVADFSDVTLTAMSSYADITVFTDTPNPVHGRPYRLSGPIRSAALRPRTFDATLSVLGNSHHHMSIFEHILEHGGAVLSHDARMINFYTILLGRERARALASAEHGADVSDELLIHWLHNQRELPVLFLSEIARVASPLIVHSRQTAKLIADLYRIEAKVLPFAQYRKLDLARIAPAPRREARRRLGWADTEFVICSFGFVSADKVPEMIVWALRLLVTWGVKARVVFCGSAEPHVAALLKGQVSELGLDGAVVLNDDVLTEEQYIDHLVATDAAVQFRTHLVGSLSGALSDCIEAAVPTVANLQLAAAIEAPDFVRRVPDNLSALLIAEALLDIMNSGEAIARPLKQAEIFAKSHSPDRYATLMMNALGFEARAAPTEC